MSSASMASPPPQPEPDLPAGYTFTPQDDEMLSVYLRHRIAREPLPGATGRFFHDADIYAAEPATLIADYPPAPARKGESNSWFFFSSVRPKNSRGSRKSRTVGDGKGTWHSERARKGVVDGEGRLVGHRQSFSYKPKNGDKSEWLMTEFGMDQEDDESRRGEPVPVLCKIYQTPRMRRSVSNPSSAGSARKRNATDELPDQTSSAPVRRRLFPSLPAPTPLAASQDKDATILESLHGFLMSVEPEAEAEAEESQGETSPLDYGFFMADHARSPLSCYGTPLLDDGDDSGIPPCAPDAETPGSWSWTGGHTTEPCVSGMVLLASLPADEEYWSDAGFAQDASYWCGKSSAIDSPPRRRHRLHCAAEWSSAVHCLMSDD